MNISAMTALEIGASIKNGVFTSVEAVTAVLDKISKTDNALNAYITVCGDEAIQKAKDVQKKIESGELNSPLAGVPISIKDNICTEGIKTSCASKILGEFKPVYNATVMDKLESAGLITIGKLNMDEFAMGSTSETSFYGAVKNPWDETRVAGGSSAGAAAAVAAGEAPLALGSDTGGSIRQPASYCAVTGFKPTYGTVSRNGLIAYASSMEQIGPIAKDVADCAAVMDIICGKDMLDGTSLDIKHPNYLNALSDNVKGMKIGLPKECFNGEVDSEVAKLVKDCAKIFEEMGAAIEEVSLPFLDYVIIAHYIIACAEASSNLSRFDGVKYGLRSEEYDGLDELYSVTRGEGFGDEVKKRILLGTLVLSSGYYDKYYQKALKIKAMTKSHLDKIFSEYDLILCPAAPSVAPELGKSLGNPLKMYLSDILTVPVNMAGLPGLSVPCGFNRDNMPVGAQIIGQRLSETKVLSAGYAYQQKTGFHKVGVK